MTVRVRGGDPLVEWEIADHLAARCTKARIGGTLYLVPGRLTFDDFEFRDGSFVLVNKCDCCGRFDTRERVARSVEEAVKMRMLWEVLDDESHAPADAGTLV